MLSSDYASYSSSYGQAQPVLLLYCPFEFFSIYSPQKESWIACSLFALLLSIAKICFASQLMGPFSFICLLYQAASA
jgi:hypothetical protein